MMVFLFTVWKGVVRACRAPIFSWSLPPGAWCQLRDTAACPAGVPHSSQAMLIPHSIKWKILYIYMSICTYFSPLHNWIACVALQWHSNHTTHWVILAFRQLEDFSRLVRETAKLIMNKTKLAGKRKFYSYLHLSEQSYPSGRTSWGTTEIALATCLGLVLK